MRAKLNEPSEEVIAPGERAEPSQPVTAKAQRKARPPKWQWIDDLDASGHIPSAQRDALRRIGSHCNNAGHGFVSHEQIASELGGKSVRSVERALNGDRSRKWDNQVDIWCEITNDRHRPRNHAFSYRLRPREEREALLARRERAKMDDAQRAVWEQAAANERARKDSL